MDFNLDNEQRALSDAVRDMVGRWTPTDPIGAPSHDTDQWKQLAEMGLLAFPFVDAGPVEVMVVAQEFGKARVRSPYVEILLAGHVLTQTGQDELLAQLGDGSALVVPALNEPERAWGMPALVKAQPAGDAHVLSGVKDPVPYAGSATHAVVAADAGLFLVEAPIVVGSGIVLDRTLATLLTDDPRVLATATNLATAALCAEAFGAMSAALDLTVGYLKTRKQFGVPLMSFQTLTHRAADLYVALELARSAVLYAAMTLAADPADSAVVSRTKVVVGKAGRLIGQEAIQMHGGIGMTAEYAVGHLTSRLTAIERTFGDTRQHLATLAGSIGDYRTVEVL